MPEPILFSAPFYTYGLFGGVLILNYLMRRAKARWPAMGTFGLVAVCFVAAAVLDFLTENVYVRLGSYSYLGVYKPLTLFYGHYYEFPLLVPLFTGATVTGFACIRYFKDDRGLTVVERAIDRVGVSSKKKYVLRLLALVGVFNVIGFISVTQYWWTAFHQAPWSRDIVSRSYFTNGVCGQGTSTACPGGIYPVPTRGTIHVSPQNQLVFPAGVVSTGGSHHG
jgi:hypothetical protein